MSFRLPPLARRLSQRTLFFVAASLSGISLGAQQSALPTPVILRVRLSPDAVSAEQLRAHPDLSSAFMIVEALHSVWMRERGVRPMPARRIQDGERSVAGENGGVQVYLDGHRMGGVETLRGIPTKGVYSIRHLDGIQAQARFGVGHSEGVIWIATQPSWDRAW